RTFRGGRIDRDHPPAGRVQRGLKIEQPTLCPDENITRVESFDQRLDRRVRSEEIDHINIFEPLVTDLSFPNHEDEPAAIVTQLGPELPVWMVRAFVDFAIRRWIAAKRMIENRVAEVADA